MHGGLTSPAHSPPREPGGISLQICSEACIYQGDSEMPGSDLGCGWEQLSLCCHWRPPTHERVAERKAAAGVSSGACWRVSEPLLSHLSKRQYQIPLRCFHHSHASPSQAPVFSAQPEKLRQEARMATSFTEKWWESAKKQLFPKNTRAEGGGLRSVVKGRIVLLD